MSENEGAEEGTVDGTPEDDAGTDGATPEPDAAHDGETGGGVGSESGVDEDGTSRGGSTADAAESGESVDEELRERVAEADPDELAREIAALRERAEAAEDRAESTEVRLDDAEDRADELESKLKRKQADFRNFKKRLERKQERERKRATEDLVERLLDVRDNLVRALDQDEDADIRPGVEKTLDQFDRVLDAQDVRAIDPEPGESVDPERHEVLMRVDSEHPAGTVDGVHRPGYEMADRVLRPAQVTVSEE